MRPLRIEYLAGTTRNEASECHRRLPSDAMRRLLSRASFSPDLSRFETSAKAGASRSSELRTVELAPSSSGPKLRVKASCCSSVMSWPGSTSTAWRFIPASIASTSAAVSGLRASIPVRRAPMCGVSGWTSIAMDNLLAQGGRDITAIDGDHSPRRLRRLGQRNEGLGHVGRGHLQAQEVAAHVVGFAQAAFLGSLGDHL